MAHGLATKRFAIILALTAAVLPLTAQAHRSWLLPSSAQLEGKAPWVTIDAATSEGIFDFDSFPLKLDGLSIIGPDGKAVTPDAPVTGQLRSTFDVQLSQPGTYRITVANAAVMASYTLNGEVKRFRGSEDEFAKAVPADAQGLKVSRMYNRFDTFVTSGKPNDTALAAAGKGLELVAVTHPSDLVAGEPATFRFLLDGQPLANLAVSVIPGGARFRNGLKDTLATTNAAGEIIVNWAAAGNYLLSTSYPPRQPKPEGEAGMQQTPGADMQMPERRWTYTATFEILPN